MSGLDITTPRRASVADLRVLSRLFAAAFLHDPIFEWIARPGGRRSAALERFFHAVLETHALPHGAVYIGDGVGAVFFPPQSAPDHHGLDDYAKLMLLFARLCGVARLARGLRFSAAIERHRPKTPHFYLAFFAVAPRLQGQGRGRALMQYLLAAADAGKGPVYLENSNPRNTAFYHRLGFAVRRNIAPLGAPPMQAMWRPGRL